MKVVATLVSAILCSTFVAGKADHKADHKEVARHLQKRFTGHATYYADGMGACGVNNGPNDFIVALNTPQYGGGSPGPQCFKTILITAGGKSAVATIMDECPGCGYGSLDFSQGLFLHFNPLSVGEFEISWQFLDGSGGGGGNNQPKTTTTYTPPPPAPTTTHTTHTHTSSSNTPHIVNTSTQTSSSRTKTSTTKKAAPTPTSTSTSYTPSTTSSPSAGENFRGISQFILALENMLGNAAGN